MNYQKHYNKLIERAKGRELDCYTEKHHIIPKCLGGHKTDPKNIVCLTAQEHYVAHQLLVKIHPGNSDLVFSAFRMTTLPNGKRSNNKLYSWLREKYSASITGKNHPMYGKTHSAEARNKIRKARTGSTLSEETKRKIGESKLGKKRKPFSEEWKKKMSDAQSKRDTQPFANRTHSIASRKKIAEAGKGRKHTPEAKKIMSEKAKLREERKREAKRKIS